MPLRTPLTATAIASTRLLTTSGMKTEELSGTTMGELSGTTTAELNRKVPRPRKANGMLVPLLVGRRRIQQVKSINAWCIRRRSQSSGTMYNTFARVLLSRFHAYLSSRTTTSCPSMVGDICGGFTFDVCSYRLVRVISPRYSLSFTCRTRSEDGTVPACLCLMSGGICQAVWPVG